MEKIQVVVIKDPNGNVWKTPKGKSSWSSVVAAKSAWNCHTWVDDGPNPYNPKIRRRRNGKWDSDAVGWSIEVGEFVFVSSSTYKVTNGKP